MYDANRSCLQSIFAFLLATCDIYDNFVSHIGN